MAAHEMYVSSQMDESSTINDSITNMKMGPTETEKQLDLLKVNELIDNLFESALYSSDYLINDLCIRSILLFVIIIIQHFLNIEPNPSVAKVPRETK